MDLSSQIFVSYFGKARRDAMAVAQEVAGQCAAQNATGKIIAEMFGPRGQEDDTLYALYDYCVENPSDLVWYTHSKGAFHHFGGFNDRHRQGQDRFVIGKDFRVCYNLMLQGASVCGPRFSTTPHPHYSGNAWWANCR